jgi:hypothetical protein
MCHSLGGQRTKAYHLMCKKGWYGRSRALVAGRRLSRSWAASGGRPLCLAAGSHRHPEICLKRVMVGTMDIYSCEARRVNEVSQETQGESMRQRKTKIYVAETKSQDLGYGGVQDTGDGTEWRTTASAGGR